MKEPNEDKELRSKIDLKEKLKLWVSIRQSTNSSNFLKKENEELRERIKMIRAVFLKRAFRSLKGDKSG